MQPIRLLLAFSLVGSLSACATPAAAPAASPSPSASPSGAPVAALVDTEGCEHLQGGPAVAVTAAAKGAGADAPKVAEDHHRYDVALKGAAGKFEGTVRFDSAEAADHTVYLSKDVPFVVRDAKGAVAFKAQATSSPTCSEIRGRYVVPLGVGVYFLDFGPASEQNVSVVIEGAEEAHDEKK